VSVVLLVCGVERTYYGKRFKADFNRLQSQEARICDNGSVAGDAVVEIKGLPERVTPTSTITAAFIWNSIVAAAIGIERYANHGVSYCASETTLKLALRVM
jgi:uncharacterized phosphosugar-binding protein